MTQNIKFAVIQINTTNFHQMRSVINISLPEAMVKSVKKEVKSGKFGSVSEFFRHILRLWHTKELSVELKKDREDFDAGKGIELKSLSDLT